MNGEVPDRYKRLYSELARVFGEDYAKKYIQSLQKTKMLSDSEVEKIVKSAQEVMQSTGQSIVTIGSYTVALVTSVFDESKVRELQSGSVAFPVFIATEEGSEIVSLILPDMDTAMEFVASPDENKVFYVVGRLRERVDDLGITRKSIVVQGYRRLV